ncbi:MAG: hypothetical protein ABIN01_20600 [Ferruginibacter sp.]
MAYKPLYKNRYPGLTPFDKGQSTIFFGRDMEKKELFYQVCLEKMVVLFGKSGLGKSSLLNAGVAPMLESNGYLPIRVRFTSATQVDENESENLLLRDFKLLLKESQYRNNIEFNRDNPHLWEYVKAARFEDFMIEAQNRELSSGTSIEKRAQQDNERINTKTVAAIPVFIFDQFEEFFHHPIKHQHEFIIQLSEIVHEETPYRILDWITDIEPDKRTAEQVSWSQQPLIKVVFSLRADSLANMQSLVSCIPTVLRNRYELKPLTPDQAAQAITGPAGKTDLGSEYTPPFSFNPNTITEIIRVLSGKTNEIESSQLQILCNFIEDKVRKQLSEKATVTVDNSIINPAEDFPKILDNFYESQLEKIPEPKDRETARKLIEDLVLNGIRDSITKNRLMNTYEVSEDLIEEIQNTRLIREEITNSGSTYELSHDTLIAPVEKSKNKRLRQEERQREEDERQRLAELAIKTEQELNEKRLQLTKETQLRAEAEKQKEEADKQRQEVEKQKAKATTRGIWVFVLTFCLLITSGVFNWLQESRGNKALDNKNDSLRLKSDTLNDVRKQLVTNNLQNAKVIYTNSERNQKFDDTTKKALLVLLTSADSISETINSGNNIYTDTSVSIIVDNVFKDELKKIKRPGYKITTQQKVEQLKMMVPH